MKTVRAVEIKECDLCGREFDKLVLSEIFTGRVKYICPECSRRGNLQLDAKQKEWRRSSRGKAVIEQYKKNK